MGVQTRFYRSPEVILTEKSYNQSADIWSLGIVFCELVKSTSKYVDKIDSVRHIFKGSSCYPISPNSDENVVKEDDQIFKILEKYPQIDPKIDFNFLSSEKSMNYLNMSQERTQANNNIADCLNHSSQEMISLLTSMLEFNPYFRPSAT